VRNLENVNCHLARKSRARESSRKKLKWHITVDNLQDYAGVWKYASVRPIAKTASAMVSGLAWTEAAATCSPSKPYAMPGKGVMTVNGNLKEVMKESMLGGEFYVRSRSIQFGVSRLGSVPAISHVHVPERRADRMVPPAGRGHGGRHLSRADGGAGGAKDGP